MKVDHTFAMTDGFSSISEGFYGENNMEHHLSYEEQLLLFNEKRPEIPVF